MVDIIIYWAQRQTEFARAIYYAGDINYVILQMNQIMSPASVTHSWVRDNMRSAFNALRMPFNALRAPDTTCLINVYDRP